MAGDHASVGVDDRTLGVEAARTLYDHWDWDVPLDRQYEPQFANAFVDEYSRIQVARAGSVDRVSSKRAGRSAVQLTEEAYRGILEVLQNAEDECASYLVVALRRKGSRKELVFVHDGERVGARTVVAMTSAYLSLKEEDARAIGKFGIGLKTLQRLGPELEVHCAPYHWAIADGDARRIQAASDISNLYSHDSGQTMIVLRLHNGQEADGLFEWFRETDARTLLFLNNVRTFEYRELSRKPRSLTRSLAETRETSYEIQVGRRSTICRESVLESADGQSWRRYLVDLPITGHTRRGKAVGATVPLGLAVRRNTQPGLLFSGLPTSESIGLPFDLGGPFESDVSRERLDTSSPWNDMLLEETRKFAQALATRALREDPVSAWALIGTKTDLESISSKRWLTERMTRFVEDQQQAVAHAEIRLGRGLARVRDLVFESADLSSVLSGLDIETIRPTCRALTKDSRDHGRWRDVLLEVLDDPEVGIGEALTLFDADYATTKQPSWFVGLAAAAVDAGLGETLFQHDSVLLSDGERVAPSIGGHGCLLVSRELAGTDLVSRLSLARQIHSAYSARSKAAQTVRAFLIKQGAFSDEHSADAVLRALAGRVDEPVDLSPADLGELARLLAEASADAIAAVSDQLGRAVTVEGYEWIDGQKSDCRVLPAEAYLPAAMDERDGWARAAGESAGIRWIQPRYAKLKVLIEAEIGARKLFRLLGAETAPRLRRPDTVRANYVERAYGLGWFDLPELWERAREQLEAKTGRAPEALLDDWSSPDLITVALDIEREKVAPHRRERARALIRTLERRWSKLYEDTSESVAVYPYRGWQRVGSMPTRWVAELADIKWLSDCARRPHAVAPVETRIRSNANASVYGADGTAYAFELGPADAESPLVKALRIGGLPRASEHLEALRALKGSHRKVTWLDVAHHYMALAAMCPARPSPRSEIDDITVSRLVERFRSDRLLWCGQWLSPSEAYRGDALFPDEAAFVVEEPEFARLWEALGIKYPTASECIQHLRRWARAKTPDDLGLSLQKTYRALAQLAEETSGRVRKDLRTLPVWTGDRWTTTRPVYYSASEAFSRTLSVAGVVMWSLPGALHALGDLPEHLALEPISSESFSVASRGGTNSAFDVRTSECFALALDLMREFVAQSMPELYSIVGDAVWAALEQAEVELVPALVLQGRVGTKSVRIDAHVFFDHEAMRFYFESPAQIGRRDVGGDLVAEAFDLSPEDRLKLSLAWVDSWQRASEGEELLHFPLQRRTPGYIDGEAVPTDRPVPAPIAPKKKARQKTPVAAPAKRHLVDVDALVPGAVRDAATPPDGGIVTTPPSTTIERPRSAGGQGDGPTGSDRKGAAGYTPWERETVGLRILGKVLAGRGVEIEDTRTQRTGADAVGTDGRYYELKVHSGVAGGPLDIRGSEVLQAREMGKDYVLVVVENVESRDARPKLTFIPNPLQVLKVHLLGKIEVTGYDNDAFEQVELEPT